MRIVDELVSKGLTMLFEAHKDGDPLRVELAENNMLAIDDVFHLRGVYREAELAGDIAPHGSITCDITSCCGRRGNHKCGRCCRDVCDSHFVTVWGACEECVLQMEMPK